MKPQDVTHHEHFFAFDPEVNERWEVQGRYDAYRTSSGETGVWCPCTATHWPTKSYAEAKRMAAAMAQAVQELICG